MENIITELVQNHGNKPVTTSLLVAEVFEKMHKNVIQDIETLCVPTDFSGLNFQPTNYTDKQGKSKKAYEITKDGFVLLAMGYTGRKAMEFKIAYINAFNAMEQTLRLQERTIERKYFDHKAILYRKKHEKETIIKSILTWFYNTDKGKQLIDEKKELKKTKSEIAQMDKKVFGYTYNGYEIEPSKKQLEINYDKNE